MFIWMTVSTSNRHSREYSPEYMREAETHTHEEMPMILWIVNCETCNMSAQISTTSAHMHEPNWIQRNIRPFSVCMSSSHSLLYMFAITCTHHIISYTWTVVKLHKNRVAGLKSAFFHYDNKIEFAFNVVCLFRLYFDLSILFSAYTAHRSAVFFSTDFFTLFPTCTVFFPILYGKFYFPSLWIVPFFMFQIMLFVLFCADAALFHPKYVL